MKLIQLMPLYIKNLDNILDQNNVPLDNSEAERKIRNFVISRNAVLIDTVNEQKQAHPVFTCGDCQGIHPETV